MSEFDNSVEEEQHLAYLFFCRDLVAASTGEADGLILRVEKTDELRLHEGQEEGTEVSPEGT